MIKTTVVGSYPQPDWLIDRARLKTSLPARVRVRELWRVAPEFLAQAQDDATVLAVRDMERAGIDVVSDGEMRRESYSNHFATALEGIDHDRPGTFVERVGVRNEAPRIVGPIRRKGPVQVHDAKFLRRCTERQIKITIPGPFTMSQQCEDEFYGDQAALGQDLAKAVNAEIRDLVKCGVDCVQIDEPYLQARPDAARQYGVEVINCALEGVTGRTALHSCFGYSHFATGRKPRDGYPFLEELNDVNTDELVIEAAEPNLDLSILRCISRKTIVVGVVSLAKESAESMTEIRTRIEDALRHVGADRLMVAPDCGMKYLPREVAYQKLAAMVKAARAVSKELAEGRLVNVAG